MRFSLTRRVRDTKKGGPVLQNLRKLVITNSNHTMITVCHDTFDFTFFIKTPTPNHAGIRESPDINLRIDESKHV